MRVLGGELETEAWPGLCLKPPYEAAGTGSRLGVLGF